MLSRRVKRAAGFTLVETTLVLALLGTTLLIGIYRFPSRQQQFINEQLFWDRFNTTWQQTIFLASSKQQRYFVHFDSGDRSVWFSVKDPNSPNGTDDSKIVIPLPATMDFNYKGIGLVKISDKGQPTPKTVHFDSTISRRTSVVIQFGWGAYRLVKS